MNEKCSNLTPCVWEALVQAAPPEWWAFLGILITVIVGSWAVVWALYHRYITRMRADIDSNRHENRNDNWKLLDKVNQTEETMLQRMDEANRELREEMRKESRDTREKMDKMIYHLSHIDAHTGDKIVTSPLKERKDK